MKTALFLALLLACLSVAAFAQTSTGGGSSTTTGSCASNTFAQQLNIALASTQSTLSGSPCTQFNGQQSCCDANTLANLNTAMANARTGLKTYFDSMQTYASTMQNQYQTVVNNLSTTLQAAVQKLYPNAPDNTNAIKNAVSSAMSTFSQVLSNLNSNAGNCAQTLLNYSAGLVCLNCAPNWNTYITSSSISLATQTCTDLSTACTPMLQAFDPLIKAAYSIASAAFQGTQLAAQLSNQSVPSFCSANVVDCQAYICNVLPAGLSFSTSTSGLNFNTPSFGLRDASVATRDLETLLLDAAAASESSAEVVAEALSSYINRNIARRLVPVDAASVSTRAVSNSYSSSGYAAVSQGQSTSLDRSTTGVAPAGSSSGGGNAAASTGVSVLVAAAVVLSSLLALIWV